MQDPNWLFILFFVSVFAVFAAGVFSLWRTRRDRKNHVRSNLTEDDRN